MDSEAEDLGGDPGRGRQADPKRAHDRCLAKEGSDGNETDFGFGRGVEADEGFETVDFGSETVDSGRKTPGGDEADEKTGPTGLRRGGGAGDGAAAHAEDVRLLEPRAQSLTLGRTTCTTPRPITAAPGRRARKAPSSSSTPRATSSTGRTTTSGGGGGPHLLGNGTDEDLDPEGKDLGSGINGERFHGDRDHVLENPEAQRLLAGALIRSCSLSSGFSCRTCMSDERPRERGHGTLERRDIRGRVGSSV